jgi:hypothetical protein
MTTAVDLLRARVSAILGELETLAPMLPTLPEMSDADEALRALRHLRKQLEATPEKPAVSPQIFENLRRRRDGLEPLPYEDVI